MTDEENKEKMKEMKEKIVESIDQRINELSGNNRDTEVKKLILQLEELKQLITQIPITGRGNNVSPNDLNVNRFEQIKKMIDTIKDSGKFIRKIKEKWDWFHFEGYGTKKNDFFEDDDEEQEEEQEEDEQKKETGYTNNRTKEFREEAKKKAGNFSHIPTDKKKTDEFIETIKKYEEEEEKKIEEKKESDDEDDNSESEKKNESSKDIIESLNHKFDPNKKINTNSNDESETDEKTDEEEYKNRNEIIAQKDEIFLKKKKIKIPEKENIKEIKVNKDGSITFTVDNNKNEVVINFRDDEIILTEKKRGGGYRGGGTKDLTFTLQDIFEAWKKQTKTSVHVGLVEPQSSCWKIKHNADGKICATFLKNDCKTIRGGKSRRSKRNLRKKKRKSKRNLRKNKKRAKN